MKKLIRVEFLVMVVLMVFVSVGNATIVASWQFDDDLTDSSGNGYGISESGYPTYDYVTSPTDKGIELAPQEDGCLVVEDEDILANIHYTTTVTFDAMVCIQDGYDEDAALLNRERVNNNEMWWRMEDTGYQRLYWRVYKDENDPAASGAGILVTGTTLINDGQWHQLTAVKSYDSVAEEITLDIYVDGVLDAHTSYGTYVTSFDQGVSDLYVGSMVSDGKDMQGVIDYITIDVTPVPEPVTIALLSAGLLFVTRHRK